MKKDKKIWLGNDKDDEFAPSPGRDTVFGIGGDDIIHDTSTRAADFYFGGRGDDFIFTDGGKDYIEGNAGRDTIVSTNMDDFIVDGGYGRDTLEFQVLFGHSLVMKEIDEHKTVLKIFADGELTQKIVARDIEFFEWYMVG